MLASSQLQSTKVERELLDELLTDELLEGVLLELSELLELCESLDELLEGFDELLDELLLDDELLDELLLDELLEELVQQHSMIAGSDIRLRLLLKNHPLAVESAGRCSNRLGRHIPAVKQSSDR